MTDNVDLDMALAEPVLDDCVNRLVEADIAPMSAGNALVLYGLDVIIAHACCEAHLRHRLRHLGRLIRERAADA